MSSVAATYRLTPIQHGMLFQWLRSGPHTGVDVEQMIMTLHGEIDVEALRRAWAEVTRRHAVLRTRFRWSGLADPMQEVLESVELPFTQHHLQEVSTVDAAARLDAWLRADRERGFELDVAPLARLALVHVGPAAHRLVWTFSHAILDGASFARVLTDVFALYDAPRDAIDGEHVPPHPFADHVGWLHAQIDRTRHRAAAHWRSTLAGFTAPTVLPWSMPELGPPTGPHLLGEESLCATKETTGALVTLAKPHGFTLNTCVQAAWALVLAAHSGEQDIVFGVTRAGRASAPRETRETVGLLINTIPARVRITPGASVVDLLKDIHHAQVAARDFEHTPLAEVQAIAETPKGASLFDSILVFNAALVQTTLRAQGGAWAEREVTFLEQTGFPLALFAYAGTELLLKISYDRARFDRGTAERLLRQLRATLETMAADPAQEAAGISCLPADERRTLLDTWNETRTPFPDDRCVHELIEEQVARSPDATAVVFRGASVTYRELDARAASLARKLRALGVGPDVLVGICAERSVEMVVGLLAILKAGGAYVPLDPRYPCQRLAWLLEDAKPLVLVTQAHLEPLLPPHAATVIKLDATLATLASPATSERAEPLAPSGVTPDNLAYVIFTSGSTGRPKGVMLGHRGVVNFFTGMDARVGGEGPGVWLAVTSISFDISVLELLWTLARGFQVVVQEEADKPEPAARGATMASERAVAFSLFYFASEARTEPGDKYRLLLEGAKFADANGFMAVWTPERHFHAFGGLYPNPSITSAAIAVVTKRIQIRAGSIVLPLHDPIRVAEEWSVVDNLSGGRVGLSFASGWHANDFALAPANYVERREVMTRGIETVKKLWRGEAVPAKSGTGEDIAVRIFPAPVQKDPPLWLTAAGSPETFALAGRLGANVLTNLLGQRVDELEKKLAVYRAARREAGHAGEGHVTLMLHTFVGTDLETVREIVRGPFIEYLKTSTDLVQKARWEFPAFGPSRNGAQNDGAPRDLTPDEMDAMMAHAFERYFSTGGLFGTPETCLSMVETLKRIGVDEIACLVDFGVAADAVLESLAHLNRLRELSGMHATTRPADEPAAWDIPAQIRRHGVTHMQCTPSLASVLASTEEGLRELAGLRKLLLGGEALPPALAARIASVVQGDVLNMYGPTETTVWSTTSRVGKHGEPITIGRPIANTELYVLDARLSPVPIGAAGELYIGGAGVARGYLDRPTLTAERFVRNPFSGDERARLYRTGDRVRLRADGDVEFLGRVDHQVKIRGHRVELGEIEAILGEHAEVRESVAVAFDDAGGKRIVAYVVPRAREAEPAEHGAWQAIWDQAYQHERSAEPTFDVAGWIDSYTGKPIPDADMREWVLQTTKRVLALHPRRVLEIGCGTGLLVFRVAPEVASYTASDFSPAALRLIEAELSAQKLTNVTLRNRSAEDFDGIEPGSVDTVVLNSVVQYLPSIEHLARVIEGAVRVLAPGGAVFIGDVRSFDLLPAFHASIELSRASDTTPRADVLEAVQRRAAREPELAVSPAFFEALRARIPELEGVSIQLKRGAHVNELTAFRYDVVLRKAGGVALATKAPPRTWAELPAGPPLDAMRALLADEPAVLAIAGIPNRRVLRDAVALAMLTDDQGAETAGQIRAALAKVEGGVDPEDVFTLDVPYAIEIGWSAGNAAAFDVVLRHRAKAAPVAAVAAPPAGPGSWASLANQPARRGTSDGLVPALREHLRQSLPEHMVPSAIVTVDALPRTPNGKIDRKRLPAPERPREQASTTYAAPANELEAKIAAVWQEVLHVDRVGLNDNFFDLGANSLLVMQANGRLRETLGKDVSLVEMFRFTTVLSLAEHLRDATTEVRSLQATQERARGRVDAMQRRRDARQSAR